MLTSELPPASLRFSCHPTLSYQLREFVCLQFRTFVPQEPGDVTEERKNASNEIKPHSAEEEDESGVSLGIISNKIYIPLIKY